MSEPCRVDTSTYTNSTHSPTHPRTQTPHMHTTSEDLQIEMPCKLSVSQLCALLQELSTHTSSTMQLWTSTVPGYAHPHRQANTQYRIIPNSRGTSFSQISRSNRPSRKYILANILLNHTNIHNQAAIREIKNATYPSKLQFAKYSPRENERLYGVHKTMAVGRVVQMLIVPILTQGWTSSGAIAP